GAGEGVERAASKGNAWAWTGRFTPLAGEIRLVSRDVAAAGHRLEPLPPRATGFEWIAARHRYLQGQLALIQGKPRDAVMILDDARAMADRASAGDVRLDIGALKGQALMVQRQWEPAETVLNETIADAQKQRDRYHEVVALVNLGAGDLLRDRFDHALQSFERALSFNDLENQLVYAVALTNAGICYQRLGEFDRAIDVQRRAVANHERPGRPRIYYLRALGELGSTYVFRGDPQTGIGYLKRAIDVAKDAGMNDEAARWSSNLANTYIRLRQWDLADTANSESLR